MPSLIAGRHRLEAACRLNLEAVPVFMYTGDSDVTAAMAEIAENLHRHDLTPAEEVKALDAWERLSEQLAADEKERRLARKEDSLSGPNGPDKDGKRDRSRVAGSSRALAEASGCSRQDVQRIQKRADELLPVIDNIVGTSLDKAGELDALVKLPEPERGVLIEKAKAKAEAERPEIEREKVSAVAILRAKVDPAQTVAPLITVALFVRWRRQLWLLDDQRHRRQSAVSNAARLDHINCVSHRIADLRNSVDDTLNARLASEAMQRGEEQAAHWKPFIENHVGKVLIFRQDDPIVVVRPLQAINIARADVKLTTIGDVMSLGSKALYDALRHVLVGEDAHELRRARA